MYSPLSHHVCTLVDEPELDYGMYLLPADAQWYERFWRSARKCLTISERNPKSTEYYRSVNGIMMKRREHLRTHPYIIHPFSVFRIYYEVFITVVYILTLIFMPLSLSFDFFLRDSTTYRQAEAVVVGFCFLDVLLNFLTGYAINSKKEVELDPSKIAKRYFITLLFFADFISLFSILQVRERHVNRTLDLCGLLRMARLPTIFRYINSTAEYFKTMKTAFKLLRYGVVTSIVFHFFACLLILVPQTADFFHDAKVGNIKVFPNSWVLNPSVEDEYDGFDTLDVMYPYALYRSVSFLLNIETNLEVSATFPDVMMESLTFVFGRIFFLFITVAILRIVLSCHSLETRYYEKINQVEGYMSQKHLPRTMQDKILSFYEYKYNRKYFKEDHITEMFSEMLKKEINMHVCQNLVNNVNLFEGLPPKSLEDILALLKVEIFSPNDLIIKGGSYGDCMYFLARGTVAVSTTSGREICHLEDGAYFGEISMIHKDKRRTANVVALGTVEVYRLEKRDFNYIFKKHPDLREKIEAVANERLSEIKLAEDSGKQKFFGRLL